MHYIIFSVLLKEGFATRSEFIRSLIRRYFLKDQFELEEFRAVPLNQLKMELAQTNKYSEEFMKSKDLRIDLVKYLKFLKYIPYLEGFLLPRSLIKSVPVL